MSDHGMFSEGTMHTEIEKEERRWQLLLPTCLLIFSMFLYMLMYIFNSKTNNKCSNLFYGSKYFLNVFGEFMALVTKMEHEARVEQK